MELADDQGLRAVSMRAIAERMGVTPMALYAHVDGKEGLLDELHGRVLGELPVLDRDLPWDEQLRAGARAVRASIRSHPGASLLIFERPAMGQTAIRVVEELYRVMLAAGVPAHDVARRERLFSTWLLGFAVSEGGGRFSPGRLSTRERRATAGGAALPVHEGLAEWLDRPVDWDAEFEADLEDMIALIRGAR
ncbi:hypothetical protein BIV57_07355 [Mangrovactinospora gilvigrisea]|uniref:HTH tetR-type domain-containing protein n=2 Tax=Mangrovactinospora gilvigrisea TaxID=1428644 RepID=A0A1J7CEN4_9ACTN|nr:hypothetical protein BIV57_07355 [Mangrovactinospora gilvigrisea]